MWLQKISEFLGEIFSCDPDSLVLEAPVLNRTYPLQPGDKNRNSKSIPEKVEEFLCEHLRSSPVFRFLSAENPGNKGNNT